MFCKVGFSFTGKNADDKKISGIITRFITSGNPWKSRIFDAIISPKPTDVKAITIINASVSKRPVNPDSGTAIRIIIASIMNPWINAVVAPPIVRPMIIDILLTGATSTSCIKPNCLSHRTEMPVYIDVSIIAIATIPGARKYR